MPHLRTRYLEAVIKKDLNWSPIVGIYGMRQAGKTTLVEGISHLRSGTLETLDRAANLESARSAPIQFCQRDGLLVIDEVQKAEETLFPAMKELVGTRRKPGQFLITGSVRFGLKKSLREALTGRILIRELLPFSISEAKQLPASDFLNSCFNGRFHNRSVGRVSLADLHRHLNCGGLPIPCFSRDEVRRSAWFDSYFETLVLRDLPLADSSLEGLSFRNVLSLLRALAMLQGRDLDISFLTREAAFSRPKVDRILTALQKLSWIDLIPPKTIGNKSGRKLRVEWTDAGVWRHAAGFISLNRGELSDQQMTLLLSGELRSQLQLLDKKPRWHHYRSRDGVNIPWILESASGSIALKYLPKESPSPMEYRDLNSLLKRRTVNRAVIIGSREAPVTPLKENLWLVPWTSVF